MMKKFQGVFGSRNIVDSNKKRGGIEMKSNPRSSVVGGFGVEMKNEEESKMKRSMSGMFGRKEKSNNTKNKGENNMFNGIKERFINLDNKVYGATAAMGCILGGVKDEALAGYQEVRENKKESKGSVTSEPVISSNDNVDVNDKGVDSWTQAEKDAFIARMKEQYKVEEPVVEVEEPVSTEPIVLKESGKVVKAEEPVVEVEVEEEPVVTEAPVSTEPVVVTEEVEVVEEDEAAEEVEVFEEVEEDEVDVENAPSSLAFKAGRLTGLLVEKSKGLEAVVTSKVKALGEGAETYLKDTSYFNLFLDVTKKSVSFTLGSVLVALPLNAIGMGALAGWVATPAAMVIGLYPMIVALSLFSKASVDSSALVEKNVREAVASAYLNRKED